MDIRSKLSNIKIFPIRNNFALIDGSTLNLKETGIWSLLEARSIYDLDNSGSRGCEANLKSMTDTWIFMLNWVETPDSYSRSRLDYLIEFLNGDVLK
jgi:hypothetical protein